MEIPNGVKNAVKKAVVMTGVASVLAETALGIVSPPQKVEAAALPPKAPQGECMPFGSNQNCVVDPGPDGLGSPKNQDTSEVTNIGRATPLQVELGKQQKELGQPFGPNKHYFVDPKPGFFTPTPSVKSLQESLGPVTPPKPVNLRK